MFVPETFTPASGMASLAVQVYSPVSLMMGEKERTREHDNSSPPNPMPFLVHVSIGVPPIPSCTVAEQVSVSSCLAVTESLERTMLTVGGEGTERRKYARVTWQHKK